MFLLGFFILGVALGPFPDSEAPAALLTGFLGVAGMAIQNAVQRVHFGYSADDTHDRNTTQLVLDAVDLIRGVEVNQVAMVRARFGRMFQGIISFAAGGAVAAILFYIAGFWCLAMPVAIGATTAIL